MELFLPSVLIFLLAAGIVIALIPRFSPLIIVTLAIALLFAGTYHHFQIFWNEYRQSTWQDTLKLFAPTLILLAIFAYLLFVILSFFTGGSVPVPSMPSIQMPSAETATNAVTAAINHSINAVNNASANISNSVGSVVSNNTNTNRGTNNTNRGGRAPNGGPTRSFLATI